MVDEHKPVIDWLLQGDPAIRWQVLRDLLAAPPQTWVAERAKVAQEGWSTRLLSYAGETGAWTGAYSPKWTSATYTLLQLIDMGLPNDHPVAQQGAHYVMDMILAPIGSNNFAHQLARCDLCVVGMMLTISVYFGMRDERIDALVKHIVDHQMDDGGWNCRCKKQKGVVHSSFHTTFNVLDGVRTYLAVGPATDHQSLLAAERAATEFMLQHKLFKSDKTDQVIHPNFLLLSYPPRWHYDILRGLDYFQRAHTPWDERFTEALDLLCSKRRHDGCWPTQHKHVGKVYFDLEKGGQASRWNTLRALRVLRWYEAVAADKS